MFAGINSANKSVMLQEGCHRKYREVKKYNCNVTKIAAAVA